MARSGSTRPSGLLFVRPRGWHLLEKHFICDGMGIWPSPLYFGLYFFHSWRILLGRGSALYFYLPKLAAVLIETIFAAFQMDEILDELRNHSAGLNCGRWDYIFGFIKKFMNDPECVLPQRGDVTSSPQS